MLQEQALITKKNNVNGFSVERNYINSKEYHDKFERLPLSKTVIESLYKEAGRLLEAVDGQETERMLAINARTGMPIVDNIERNGFSDRTSFTEAEYKKIQETEDTIILVHNHSYNRPPSGRDIVSYALDDQIRMSLVLCHDGDVYAIMRAQKVIADMYEKAYNAYKETYDINMAKTLATKLLYDFNESGKLFEVRRL